MEYIINKPLLTFALLGFAISYIFFFIVPIFLNSDYVMKFFMYVPSLEPIGVDLKQTLSFSEAWFIKKQTPYIGFPPLAQTLFVPLLYTKFFNSYAIITFISLICYGLMTYHFPKLIAKQGQPSPLLILIFITGLLSYGLHFEIERGQFNIITMFLCFLAVYLYHYHHRFRYWAYMLFVVSVQLKLYPAIFIFLFIKDWRDWKGNIKRFAGLAIANFCMLFILGFQAFNDYLNYVRSDMSNPYIWQGNHSIRSFVTFMVEVTAQFFEKMNWLFYDFSSIAEALILFTTAVCLFMVILQAYRQNQNGINLHLLLVCTICTLIIPTQSHDYKLSILPFAVALFFTEDKFREKAASIYSFQLISRLLVFVFFTAYATTLISYTNKPWFIENNFIALMVMLIITTILSILFNSVTKKAKM